MLLGAVNLAEVVDAGVLLGGVAGPNEVRDGDGRQEANDGHHDHDFYEREARFIAGVDFHNYTFLFGVNTRSRRVY